MDLVGEKVRLRAPRDEDAAFYARNLADPEVVRYLGQWAWRPYGEQDAHHFIAAGLPTGMSWTIESVADGTPLGSVGLDHIDHRNRNCRWGIWIGPPDQWNRGYGSEACRLSVAYAFNQLGMEKVMLELYEGNDRARRSYEKAGFSSEGIRRRHIWLNGRLVDVEQMAVFRDHPLYKLS